MSSLMVVLLLPLIIASALLAAGWVWRIRFRNLRRGTLTDCAGVAALHDGVPCQVTGTALAVQPAPFSGTPCAWYKIKATAKTRAGGKRVFVDEKSKAPFYLQDKTGRLTVFPENAAVDAPVQTMDERRAHNGNLPGVDEEVAEYRYEEWILPADGPLYVLGTSTGGSIGKDKETGQYSITTRTRRDFQRRAVMFMGIGYGGGSLIVLICGVIVLVNHIYYGD
ncbi:GIDE domain-containing protein [Actinomadura spongiicola]|uniref:GIDE domain-containing protein n=1 Tax=Actinomadura spongiicola TaxID=2303421 RepID=UPI001314A308|nr:GIDE domain-containing protein [Actinomadura spongiicola]